jgi:cellulose biosynthesis protein BcsQ/Arc/MetJ-type ribon-helix-helix transcriptional regulator
MKTLDLCNQKGGVGKSAVATLLAHHLAHRGRRVLAIDLDHQGNFSKPLRMSGRVTASAFTSDALMTGAAPALPQRPFVLVPGDRALLGLERQPALHTPFARHFRSFLAAVNDAFDVCVVDTNPNPDIRVIAALASADFVLSPIQLNQEAMDGVSGLLNHDRVGLRKIKAVLNSKLSLIGFQRTDRLVTPSDTFARGRLDSIVSRRPGRRARAPFAVCAHQHAAQMRYTARMKTATIPSVRVDPEFRAEVESLLGEGETLSEFVEASVRATVQRRRVQAEFIARGLRSRDEARRTGEYVDADVVVEQLQRKLDAARSRIAKTKK